MELSAFLWFFFLGRTQCEMDSKDKPIWEDTPGEKRTMQENMNSFILV